ncbi:BgTH12-00218 [Blumeria graminis f. sp. triticale]|uniref:Fungal-type protein kinase domain-containing protein n=5 Tax=Blumeria graminis TaxID=34373 RepID=A0A656KI22_BLUGR|nr:hypothetical protein BGT96224_4550 [Blumeria graminis f. sp. tritici 96224]CAD6504713.1 BgTH12-00218 [Blumeria graminis f. sp. triticale]VDB92758.1 Bgt-4550 [Blumeria graminis f. sp. tritici]
MLLSRRDLEFVQRNPLRPILVSFMNTFKVPDEEDKRTSKEKEEDDKSNISAICKLLVDLANYAIEKNIGSGFEVALDGQLISLYSCLRAEKIRAKFFDPLTQAINNYCSDTEIWKTVFQLISDYSWSKEIPSKMILHSFYGSPFIPPSAKSMPEIDSDDSNRDFLYDIDDSDKWKVLKRLMKPELSETTFENVGGFWKKYFEDKEWVERCTLVFNALNQTHSGCIVPQYPDMLNETTFWMWLETLQTHFLDQCPDSPVKVVTGDPEVPEQEQPNISRCKYNRLKKSGEKRYDETRWQLDIFSKFRHVPEDRIHHWKDVLVVGVVTSLDITKVWNRMYLRLAVYMREILLTQHLRKSVHGFMLFGTQLQLWVFDHSGSFSSDTIDITKEPERFIRAIVGYTFMNDGELGLDQSLRRDGERTFVTIKDAYTGEDKEVELDPAPITMRQANDMHGNVCFKAVDGSCMVKFAWKTVTDGPSEVDKLRALQHIQGIPKLIGSAEGTTTSQLRSGLKFTTDMAKKIKEERRESDSDRDWDEDYDS